jgi:hypothetical protein
VRVERLFLLRQPLQPLRVRRPRRRRGRQRHAPPSGQPRRRARGDARPGRAVRADGRGSQGAQRGRHGHGHRLFRLRFALIFTHLFFLSPDFLLTLIAGP